jgi:hypothetical protein
MAYSSSVVVGHGYSGSWRFSRFRPRDERCVFLASPCPITHRSDRCETRIKSPASCANAPKTSSARAETAERPPTAVGARSAASIANKAAAPRTSVHHQRRALRRRPIVALRRSRSLPSALRRRCARPQIGLCCVARWLLRGHHPLCCTTHRPRCAPPPPCCIAHGGECCTEQ